MKTFERCNSVSGSVSLSLSLSRYLSLYVVSQSDREILRRSIQKWQKQIHTYCIHTLCTHCAHTANAVRTHCTHTDSVRTLYMQLHAHSTQALLYAQYTHYIHPAHAHALHAHCAKHCTHTAPTRGFTLICVPIARKHVVCVEFLFNFDDFSYMYSYPGADVVFVIFLLGFRCCSTSNDLYKRKIEHISDFRRFESNFTSVSARIHRFYEFYPLGAFTKEICRNQYFLKFFFIFVFCSPRRACISVISSVHCVLGTFTVI